MFLKMNIKQARCQAYFADAAFQSRVLGVFFGCAASAKDAWHL